MNNRYSHVASRTELKALQRLMSTALFRPLTRQYRMQSRWADGSSVSKTAEGFIKPNDRLSAFERLEIYSKSYWCRIIDCLYDDYPGLLAILGEKKFSKLAVAYLSKYPSASFTLRNLGSRLEGFLRKEPRWITPRKEMALDMVRFEWAQVVAFDGPSLSTLTPESLERSNPAKLCLALQPYISILKLNYSVNEFHLALKDRGTGALRDEASNAIEPSPKRSRQRRLALPKRKQVFLAVHRHNNMLYFKQLEPEAYHILTSIAAGDTLEQACVKGIISAKRKKPDWPITIKQWFANWSSLGWFCKYR